MKAKIIITFCLFLQCLFSEESYDLIIIGSGPAGLTAGIYAARANINTLILEGSDPCGQIALSYLVENFPGFPEGINGYELSEKMKKQALLFGANFKSDKVNDLDVSQYPFRVETDEACFTAKSIIIATGASTRWLGIAGEKELIGYGVSSCATCDGALYKDKKVCVIGGGNSAIEEALFLSKICKKVTVIHRNTHLKATPILIDRALKTPNIEFIFNHELEEILDPKTKEVTSILIKDINTNQRQTILTAAVFIAIGHEPNTKIFKKFLDLDDKGYIKLVPFSTKTNVKGVFAAGDVADSLYKQAITAAAFGCMAAIEVTHFLQNKE